MNGWQDECALNRHCSSLKRLERTSAHGLTDEEREMEARYSLMGNSNNRGLTALIV